ncbi:MAG: glutathione S-transferase family protein [Rhodobiaceae bacterium]|nr:glutathione S-transferase family protein [Rhodobiaceae bacterium]
MITLHFAPDNASLVVRAVLEELGETYEAVLVDRAAREQDGAAYRALNPNGLIPVCIIDGEPVFETGAIVLTLAERAGRLVPLPGEAGRNRLLKWLFFISNTLHPALRHMFYPERYAAARPECRAAQAEIARHEVVRAFTVLDGAYAENAGPFLLGDALSVADVYAGLAFRWAQLYPLAAPGVVGPADVPALARMAENLQARPSFIRACAADGIAAPCLVRPSYPDGTKGAAL